MIKLCIGRKIQKSWRGTRTVRNCTRKKLVAFCPGPENLSRTEFKASELACLTDVFLKLQSVQIVRATTEHVFPGLQGERAENDEADMKKRT